jgi:hypothetical protein
MLVVDESDLEKNVHARSFCERKLRRHQLRSPLERGLANHAGYKPHIDFSHPYGDFDSYLIDIFFVCSA